MAEDASHWKRCSSCKKDIGFSTIYWVCSVSTCNRKRTGMVFCSVGCWEIHLPMMRHRESYAVEKRSPGQAEWMREQAQESSAMSRTSSPAAAAAAPAAPAVRRRVATPEPTGQEAVPAEANSEATDDVDEDDMPHDILVVASKLKQYIRARSGMNTSDSVLPILSDHLRALCRQAIRSAAQNDRKTVLDRDIPRPPRPGS